LKPRHRIPRHAQSRFIWNTLYPHQHFFVTCFTFAFLTIELTRSRHFFPGDDFIVLGFPCNQFGGQEPLPDADIQSFCQINYGVSFPIMAKTNVNGDQANPLFEWLKNEQPGLLGMKRVKWNFEKWLVGKDGKVKGRWASTTKPETLEKPILDELKKGKSEL
jgi:glutathione peroxidase-family protein